MELEHSFTVPVPMERAWDVLLDVERVAPCMPGATLDSVTGDDIAGRIKVKVGPITMTYAGHAKFTERDKDARVVTLEASGKETRGAGTASASVRSQLSAEGDTTHVIVHTNLNVTGKPAQFGRGVMAEVGGKLIGIFADNLAAMLAEEHGPGTEDESDVTEDVAESGPGAPDEGLPIDVLNLPTKAWSSLRAGGIQTLGDMIRRTPEDLLALDNIGPASVAEISRRLADRGLALADSGDVATAAVPPAAAEAGTAVPPARPAQDDAPGGPSPSYHDAAERAAANGGAPAETSVAPREPVRWQPRDEAIDLLGVAGLPVLKRVVPALAGLVALILVVLGIRRRRARRG